MLIPDDRRCTAHSKRSHKQCGSWAIPGGTVCYYHGGAAGQVRRAAERRLHELQVADDVNAMLVELDVEARDLDAHTCLRECVARTWLWVQLLGAQVGKLSPAGTDWAVEVIDGKAVITRSESLDSAGIFGPDHQGDGAPHILVTMYGTWLDRHARACKLAIDAGLAEREVRLAEEQGALIAKVLTAAAGELGLDLDDPKVRETVGRHLRAVG